MTGLVHVITGLEAGGAERQLLCLLQAQDPARRGAVVALVAGGRLEPEFRDLGVPLRCLGMARGRIRPGAIAALREHLRTLNATVVQSWMYHASIAATFAAQGTGTPVSWAIRHALHKGRNEKALTRMTIQAGALMSRRARAIVYNSVRAREQHAAMGYRDDRAMVIPNGFGLPPVPTGADRQAARAELSLPGGPVITMLARFDPLKDFPTMRDAALRLNGRYPGVTWLLAGDGVQAGNAEFARLFPGRVIPSYLRALGHRADTATIFAASDVVVSSSLSEALPNVIGEAMAHEIPCAVTDVGDSAALVGSTGRVVPPRDPARLAEAIESLLVLPAAERGELGRRARARIAEDYSVEAMVARFECLFESLRGTSRA